MLDCGANECYLGPAIRQEAKIGLTPLEAPDTVTTVKGEGVEITSKGRPRMQIGSFIRRLPYKLAPIELATCILGISFLDGIGPLIRWKERRMRVPVQQAEGQHYGGIHALPRAIATVTNTNKPATADPRSTYTAMPLP